MTKEKAVLKFGSDVLKIYDDFENMICENCKHCSDRKEFAVCMHNDNIQEIHDYSSMQVTLEFGCNKWEEK